MNINRLLLASQSPYRSHLLKRTGISFGIIASTAREEDIELASPRDLALLRAEHKASGIPSLGDVAVVITADQVLEHRGKAYGKAKNRDDARERLLAMSGSAHYLHSAYGLFLKNKDQKIQKIGMRLVTAELEMRSLASDELEAYLDLNEWQGCAGCYQFEGYGIHLFSKVSGEISTIIGLPLLELLQDLREIGINGLVQGIGPWALTKKAFLP